MSPPSQQVNFMTTKKPVKGAATLEPAAPTTSEPQKQVEPDSPAFPVVGIGASAGGLAAFEAFFSAMPADRDPGMAFVLVQHLAPDHKSILRELIARCTRMQVFEVEDGMVMRPNCVYIIPPNRDMALLNGALQLLDPLSRVAGACRSTTFSARSPPTSASGPSVSCSRGFFRRTLLPKCRRSAWRDFSPPRPTATPSG